MTNLRGKAGDGAPERAKRSVGPRRNDTLLGGRRSNEQQASRGVRSRARGESGDGQTASCWRRVGGSGPSKPGLGRQSAHKTQGKIPTRNKESREVSASSSCEEARGRVGGRIGWRGDQI